MKLIILGNLMLLIGYENNGIRNIFLTDYMQPLLFITSLIAVRASRRFI